MHEGPSQPAATASDASRLRAGFGGYLRSRWRGEVPLATIFWDDMLVVGTAVNLVATLLAMLLLSVGAPNSLVLLTFLGPLPFSVFLVAAVWRSAESCLMMRVVLSL